MVHFDAPYLTIHWDEKIKCVYMQWKTFVNGEKFREALDTGLDLIISQKSKKWLADLRDLGVVTKEDQQWSNEDWFPRAINAGILYMAIVMPHSIIAKWSVDAIMQKVENTNLTVHYFKSVQEAQEWLASQS